jgi:serine carboxypeptidase 1
MRFTSAAVAVAALLLSSASALPAESWGYVDVRPGAHSFWWLYEANSTSPAEVPLIMWLQGGPGASGTGYGNFMEMGPLDVNLNPRATTWLNAPANLLFVDSPVGTGWSWVENNNLIPTNNSQIGKDLTTLAAAFFEANPAFASTPFWIFTESYGGKMATSFALELLAAMDAGSVKCNFQGMVMGDSWISGQAHVDAWGPLLSAVSLVDSKQLAQIEVPVAACDAACAAGQWAEATQHWGEAEGVIDGVTDGVDL